ncbi:AraC family transcriptional regulator ligand-binding domain-containing protein [Haliea sp.]|uniref:AraC family transcriptional regulator n=1 Tax=Haliea sp. TaxID=1932666 RepID=UPI0035287941
MAWLLDYLAGLGMDAGALARTHGIHVDQLHRPEARISEASHHGVLRDAQASFPGRSLGLQLGLHRSMATLDQLAYLMMSSATLRESIAHGLRFQNYPGRFSGFQLVTAFSEIEGQGCYQIHAHDSLGDLRLLVVEELLAAIVTTSRWVLGRALPVTALKLDYPAPVHHAEYAGVFNAPIQFDSAAIQLFFAADILDQPLPHASPQSAALYARLCEETSISRSRGDMAWRVWQIIVENPAEPPGLEECAALLHCSVRTLSRKLQAQGWQYQHLVDQVREIHARRYLSHPRLSITHIAHQLGYADSSGFHRAFKKWTGLSPSEFRARLFA